MTSPVATITLFDLIDHAQGLVTARIDAATEQVVQRYAAAFDAARAVGRGPGDVNIVTFHADVPDSHRHIDYVDVQHDHHAFDYGRITQQFADSALTFNPDATIYFVTDLDGAAPRAHPRLRVVRLPLDTRAPMYERVKAVTAYVRSAAFDRDTVFLDTDAFANQALAPAFGAAFDVGVTERPSENFYMPINEGVIYAAASRPAAVRTFFDRYLGTYGALIRDEAVKTYYGDITRWRGGQLALNAVAQAAIPLSTDDEPRVVSLPCDSHNFCVAPASEPDPLTWNDKYVLHLKGESKAMIAALERYQHARFREFAQCPAL